MNGRAASDYAQALTALAEKLYDNLAGALDAWGEGKKPNSRIGFTSP